MHEVLPRGKDQVDDFRDAVDKLESPIYVHCAAGKRAGALAMMHRAVQQGCSGERTLEEAQRVGLECDDPALATFVKQYVDENANPE